MDGAFALPLARDPSSRFLPWIVGFMVFLAALALAAAMAVSNAAAQWRHDLSGTLTVQVLPLAQDGATGLDQRMAAALALLRTTPGVASVAPLSRERIAALLEPWLGKGASAAELPLPLLIDVTLAEGTRFDADALAARLAEKVPGTAVDAHGVWLRHLTVFARAMEFTAAAVVGLICIAAIAIVVFATRAGLAVHGDSIEILHLIGARDGAIARQFQLQAMWLGFKGGVFGIALAAATLAALYRFASRIDAALMPSLDLSVVQWIALAVLPVGAAAIGMETARRTVLRALRKMA